MPKISKNSFDSIKMDATNHDIEWESVTSFSGLPGEENGTIKYVAYQKNPPVIFGPKSTVKRLDVSMVSTQSDDEELLHHLLQKTK